jgi:protein O-mannosyl-transferase
VSLQRSGKPRELELTGGNWIPVIPLLLAVLTVYARVTTFGFVNYDDPDYTFENVHVNGGLTADGVVWAFTRSYAANWHPLTWISHMLDFEFYGSRAGMHHLTSVLLHAGSTLLLFFLLQKMTGSTWRSLFVAFGFALHPFHVESVAWISERKDVLSVFFFFLTLWAYAAYARDSRPLRYMWVAGLFVCALLSKQMAVTLPVVTLVLDFWPLRRGYRVMEKIPLMALAIGAATMAFVAQQRGGAVFTLGQVPLLLRLANVPIAYVTYLLQFLWPANLAVFYPYRSSLGWWWPILALFLMMAISALAWNQRTQRPYLLAGWLWYLITLLPVVGIIQIGAQAHADRYTYVPLVGILIALAWAAAELAAKPAAYALTAIAIVWISLTWFQLGYWADSITLFRHAIAATRQNYLAYNNLGEALSKTGDLPEAIAAYQEAVRIQPQYAKAHYNLGTALMESTGRRTDAIRELETAVMLDPQYAKANNNLGKALAQDSESLPAAIEHYKQALRADPDLVEAHINLANAFAQDDKVNEAMGEYQVALRLDPTRATTHFALANLLTRVPERTLEAIAEYRRAIEIQPNFPEAQNNLGSVLASIGGHLPEAIAAFQSAVKSQPDYAEAHFNLGNALTQTPGRMPDAIAEWRAAIRSNPQHFRAHYNLGVALAQSARKSEAITEFEAAYRIQPDPKIREIMDQLRNSR